MRELEKGDKERQRHRERQTDRQTDRQADRQTDRQTEILVGVEEGCTQQEKARKALNDIMMREVNA